MDKVNYYMKLFMSYAFPKPNKSKKNINQKTVQTNNQVVTPPNIKNSLSNQDEAE